MLLRGFFAAALVATALPVSTAAQPASSAAPARIVVPAGTSLELVVINPVWAKTTRPGDPLYAQTDFPVGIGGHIAIPAGAWVQGEIQSVTQPTFFHSRAEIQALFSRIVFPNGYVVSLPVAGAASPTTPDASLPTVMKFTIDVSRRSDVLLDNGSQMQMILASPLALDADQVAKALPLTHAPAPGTLRSASRCRPIPGSPGTPGTPDTVIPGSPGTPDTVIPGGPGMPDTVIPGTPATPETVIPGTPGTPGTPDIPCPSPPMVISSVPVAQSSLPKTSAAPAVRH